MVVQFSGLFLTVSPHLNFCHVSATVVRFCMDDMIKQQHIDISRYGFKKTGSGIVVLA
jgi:hypothetical protein